jgi:hypothetical protein
MTACLPNNVNGAFADGVDGFVYPQFLGYALRAPTTQDIYNPGTRWQDNSVNPPVIYQTTGAGRWITIAGGGESLTSLVVAGPSTLTGTTLINTTGAAATTLGTGGTGAVAIGNATGGTTFTGPITSSGNETFSPATVGVVNTPATVGAGASPQTVNGRTFSVIFSGVSIAAGATQSFTIANSVITGATTLIQYTLIGATSGAALTIQSVTNSAGLSVIVVTNGTGATTTVANITFIGTILN